MSEPESSALYIHIPFCEHKCIYCDFYSIITFENETEFINSLKKEIHYYSAIYKNELTFSSIFFGGGTPSLLKTNQIEEILNCLLMNLSLIQILKSRLKQIPAL
jgi:oxygen-independent coproporphyrinogen-3 oxidase